MMRVAIFACVVFCAVVSVNGNWYGKRGEKEDMVGNFLRNRIDNLAMSDAEATLAAIGQVYKDWIARKAGADANTNKRR